MKTRFAVCVLGDIQRAATTDTGLILSKKVMFAVFYRKAIPQSFPLATVHFVVIQVSKCIFYVEYACVEKYV